MPVAAAKALDNCDVVGFLFGLQPFDSHAARLRAMTGPTRIEVLQGQYRNLEHLFSARGYHSGKILQRRGSDVLCDTLVAQCVLNCTALMEPRAELVFTLAEESALVLGIGSPLPTLLAKSPGAPGRGQGR